MKLTDLNPHWVGAGGEGITRDGQPVPRREGVAVMFDCPSGCGEFICVNVEPAMDGGPRYDGTPNAKYWQRTGDTFDTLTLTPSILRIGGCGWHGFVTNGEIRTC